MTGTFVANQTGDWEEGRPTDADALSPDWDHTVLEGVAGFDAELDADSDLNDSTANPKLGTTHLRVTFDDANAAFGRIDATSPGQTEGVIELRFDPTSVSFDSSATEIATATSSQFGATEWGIEASQSGGSYRVRVRYRDDSANIFTSWINISDAYVHLRLVLKASTGAGNDDGFIYLYAGDGDAVSTIAVTGVDNDTRVWDVVRVGVITTDQSSGFGGSFDIDEIRVSETVSPVWITEAAALAGSYGAAFTIEDTTDRYTEFTDPVGETKLTAETRVDPNSLTMATNDILTLIECVGEFKVELAYDGTNYELRATVNLDSGTTSTSRHDITDASRIVRGAWRASTGVGNDDGDFALYDGNTLLEYLSGLDNDTLSIDEVRFGAQDLDSGTSGVFFMDDMKWSDDIVDVVLEGSVTPTGTETTKVLVTTTGAVTPTGTNSLKAMVTLVGSVTPTGSLLAILKQIASVLFNPNASGSARFESLSDTDNQAILENEDGSVRFES